jgi:hypothetical protein
MCAAPAVALKEKIASKYFLPDINVADTCVMLVNDAVPRRVV